MEREVSRVDRYMDAKDRLPGDKVKACFFHCATLGMFFPCLALTCQDTLQMLLFAWGVGEWGCTIAKIRRRYQDRASVGEEVPGMCFW